MASKRTRATGDSAREDRVFVRDGFRSYRRTYRPQEVRWGLGTGAVLASVLGWVVYKGRHPDPELFDVSASLLGDPEPAVAAAERGPIPEGLAGENLAQGRLGRFGADDLYVKINGRAGYFRSFGVVELYALTLASRPGGEGPPISIDIELYDMAEGQNAIGAYNGERSPGLDSRVVDGSTYHFDRNAAFLARGPYYVRLIGSDESPAVQAELQRVMELLRASLPGAELPWAFSLFVDQMKLEASRVTYLKNNAFSFGFASDVYKALLSDPDATDDVEAFVVALDDAAAASALAEKFRAGFESLGELAGETEAGVPVYRDQFLGTLATATRSERWVVGIRGASGRDEVHRVLAQMERGLSGLPPEVRARAVPAAIEVEAPEQPSEPAASEPVAESPPEGERDAEPVEEDGHGEL